jgi:hypothetical protein
METFKGLGFTFKLIKKHSPCFTSVFILLIFVDLSPKQAWALQQVTGDTVTITWEPSPGATGYVLYYSPYPEADQVGKIDVGNRTEATFNVWEGAAFYVALQAYSETETSEISNIVSFLVTSDVRPPPKRVDLTVNGQDCLATLSSGETVSVALELDPGDYEGTLYEAWVTADGPLGFYSYIEDVGWTPGLHRFSVMPLHRVAGLELFGETLPDGFYTLYLAVDDNWDGVPDGTWFDSVEATVH